ncbi:MAG TPA: sulfatase [Pirellulales bacterium]|jgi:uncharacterized sulfatase
MRFGFSFCVVLVCLIGLAVSRSPGDEPRKAPRPNIVLIVSDDHGWGDYSFMGHPQVQTPNLDRLARESVTFRHGYVPSSLCCPSLASIITGLYPHQSRITSNDPPLPPGMAAKDFHQSKAFLDGRETMNRHLEAVRTLPTLLKAEGYRSLQTGKWWQGDYRRGGFTHGMTRGQRHGDDGLEIGRKTMAPINEFMDEAVRDRTPFFLWYAPMMPHDPHTPPERLLKKYRGVAPSDQVARYWGMIDWFDETVGELLGRVHQLGLDDNTIVVYLADNGWIQDPAASGYAAKSKQSQYDGGLRTPIMIRWPGHASPRSADELALSIDIAPTLLAALGQSPPREMQGVNLLDEKALGARKAIFGECFTHNAVDLNNPAANLRWRWEIEWPWKLILPHAANEPDGKIELYDLSKDPNEKQNLAAEQPEIVARMRDATDKWWNPAAKNVP